MENEEEEFAKVVALVREFIPQADEEDIEDMVDELLAKQPDMTFEQFEKYFRVLAPQISDKIMSSTDEQGNIQAPENAGAKMAALKGLGR